MLPRFLTVASTEVGPLKAVNFENLSLCPFGLCDVLEIEIERSNKTVGALKHESLGRWVQ